MILQGSQRGGPRALAKHLLNAVENDHVEVHQIHGLATEDLTGALLEIDASKGASRSNKPFYHLSFNPPPEASPTVADFESAIAAAETTLGLEGQPRAVVFHEKYGRRHAHVVWSRVDQASGRMIRISFDRRHLQSLSISLYEQHGWRMPIGFHKGQADDPHNLKKTGADYANYTHDEWVKSIRSGISPAEHKRMIASAYTQSDSAMSFRRALEHQGYYLARGHRGFVAVDLNGEPHSVMRAAGERKKAVEAKLGDAARFPTVEQVQDQIAARRTAAIEQQEGQIKQAHAKQAAPYRRELEKLRAKQRAERKLINGWQDQHFRQVETELASRYRKGVMGLLDRITGKSRRIDRQIVQERSEEQAKASAKREEVIRKQIAERRALQQKMLRLLRQQRKELGEFRGDVAALLSFDRGGRLDVAQDHIREAATQRESERKRGHRRHRGYGRGMRPEPDGPA